MKKVVGKKKMEMEDLALLMRKGFGEIHQKMATKMEMEDLSLLMHKGFGEIHQKMATKMEMEDLSLLMRKGFGEIHQKMATKMEMEDLAVMVQNGFEEVHEKFKDMDNKMATKEDLRVALGESENRLDDKIEGLGMRFGSYMSDCEMNFDELDIRVGKIEDKIAKVK